MTIPNNANTFLPPVKVIPGFLLITNISNTNPMVITFTDSVENTYQVNMCVHLNVPASYGMFQANQLIGQILSINSNTFTVSIDATQFDAFVTPSTYQPQPATMAPAGSRNLQYDNFSKNVPFQDLNNQGN